MDNLTKKGIFFGLASGLLWAISSITYESLYTKFPTINVFTINIFILLLADSISFISIFLYLSRHKKLYCNKDTVYSLFFGLIGGPIAMLFYIQSIQEIGTYYTAIFSICYPVIVYLLSAIILNQRTSKSIYLNLINIILLISLLSYKDDNLNNILKIALPIFCAICWAIEIVLSSTKMRKNDVDIIYLYRQLGSSLGYLMIIIYQLNFNGVTLRSKEYYDIITNYTFLSHEIVIIISSGLSYFLYYKSIDILKPINAVVLNITYSIWIVLISFFIFESKIKLYSPIIILLIIINIFSIIKKELS